MFNNTFHEVVNSENTQQPKKKNLGTMRGPRTVRKPVDHQQQQSSASSSSSALARRTEQQRKKIGITSTKAKGFTAQQQPSTTSSSNSDNSGQRQHNGHLEQVHHQQQQQQNNDQTFVNVTTCTEGVVEYSMSPSISPTRQKRKAAQAAALLFEKQQCQPRLAKLVRCPIERDTGTPKAPVEESSNNNNNNSTEKTGKQLRQQRKNNNRKVIPRTLISVDSNVPAKV